MIVTKVGELPENDVFDAKCLNCKTEVSFKRLEARRESSCRNETFLIVVCPICYREIWKEI
jgi:uncharacterized protein with PIN domain